MKPILLLAFVAATPMLLTGCISVGGDEDVYYDGPPPVPPPHPVVVTYVDQPYCYTPVAVSARDSNNE